MMPWGVVTTRASRVSFLGPPLPFLQPCRDIIIAHAVSSRSRQTSLETLRPAPTVTYRGKILHARKGENLRKLLLRCGCHPHNGGLLITCKGSGTCGTCAVAVEGCMEPAERSWREHARLSIPPHTDEGSKQKKLRLACQVRVVDDLSVEKYDGFWGHGEVRLEQLN